MKQTNSLHSLKKLEHQLAALTREVARVRQSMLSGKSDMRRAKRSKTSDVRLAAYLALAPELSEDEMLRNLLRCAMHTVNAGGAGLTLLDRRKRRLVFRAALGDGAEGMIGREVPLKGSQHGLAFATGEVQSSTPLYNKLEESAGVRFRNVLVAPMFVSGEPVGTISAVNKQDGTHFMTADIAAFKLFAELAALIVQQRCREEVLRKGISRYGRTRRSFQAPISFAADDWELLCLFRMLSEIKQSRNERLGIARAVLSALNT